MTSKSVAPPPQLGRYRVVRRLGAGGMAEVFLARSAGAEGVDKLLVVKRVLPTFARSQKFRSMFIDEAKVAMRLNHSNVVQVYAFEQAKDEFLLAMEFIDGLDVGRLVSAAKRKGTKFPYALAAYIVSEVAKGLDYAHHRKDEQGESLDIVHRDVSPQNVLLSYEGAVKIADFGIARARLVSEDTGVIKGKFSYMSPEQARGTKIDKRSDVYALGVLLAELLMGRAMYAGQVGLEVLELVRQGTRTLPRSVDPSVPKELDDIVKKATAFDVDERYPTARALAVALSHWLHSQDDIVDGATLESFIVEHAPREVTSNETGREGAGDDRVPERTRATLAGNGEAQGEQQEFRERRPVVVISGRVHAGTSAGTTNPGTSILSREAERVLREMAYKNDAVFRVAEQSETKRTFRMVLGLGRVTVHEPLRASRLALDILDALAGVSVDQGEPLRVSLGISRGIVTMIRSADGRLRKFEPTGAVLDMADRLAAAGIPGEILAAGEIYRTSRRDFSFEEQGGREIAFTTPQGPKAFRAYRLAGARTREERAAEVTGTGAEKLIGRSTELGEVVDAYTDVVQTNKSSYMLLVGELGVGKSAIVRAALDAFEPKPHVYQVDCSFSSSEVAFGAVLEIVRDACGVPPDASPQELTEKLQLRLAPLIRNPSRLREVSEGLEAVLLPRRTNEGSRAGEESQRISQAVRAFLGALAREKPLVIVFDSMQWIDAPSLSFLSSIVRSPGEVPLLALFVTRPDAAVEAALSVVPRLEVGELDASARQRLLRSRFDDIDVPAEIEQAVFERAGGNPYFIHELVEALVDRGIVHFEGEGDERRIARKPGPITLPTTLEGTVAARLADLPDEERRALRCLAVAGPGFAEADLINIAGRDIAEALSSLVHRGLLERRAGGTIAFASGVVRHVAYESADLEDRRGLHKRVAAHLASLGASVAPARIARHLERAGESLAAARAYVAAAGAAQGTDASHYALRLYGKALALFPSDDPERFRVHELREALLRAAGRKHERRIELEAMRALAEKLGDVSKRAWSFNYLARYELDESRTAGVDALLRRAMSAAIEANDKVAEVEALRLSAHLAREEGEIDHALDACDRALVRAGRDEAMLSVRGDVLTLRGMLLRRVGRLDEACENGAEAVVIFRRLSRRRDEAAALSALSVSLASSGSFEDAIALSRASIELDREAGVRVGFGYKLSNLGQLYAELGDVQSATAYLERALEVFEVLGSSLGHADALTAFARVVFDARGDFEVAEALLDRARQLAGRFESHYDLAQERLARARLAIARGHYDDALAVAREAVDEARISGVVTYVADGLAVEAEALALLGRYEEARDSAFAAQTLLHTTSHVERAEALYASLHHAFLLVDRDIAHASLSEARSAIGLRVRQIRDPRLRECYLGSSQVRRLMEEI